MPKDRKTARAEVVGSLLQPDRLLEARAALEAGTISEAELRAVEDRAVDEAIALQQSAGLDVITDGEMRRRGWADTPRHLNGLEVLHGERSYPAAAHMASGPAFDANAALTVTGRISPKASAAVGEEYPYLRAHATSRTKYTMAAPSYHRRLWVDSVSSRAYPNCEAFLEDVRDWQRQIAARLVAEGCDYIQLDAPNYGTLCDPVNRRFHEERGHDLDAQVAFDAALDSSVFDGLEGVTRALHICRGNMPGGTWHSSGGYGVLADQLFPNLDVDVVLLEYDSDRAGDFGPLAKVKEGTIAVLGLLTTKSGELEDRAVLEARIKEAAAIKPLEELALSTQCGFASAANAPMTVEDERAKLALVAELAHRTWG